MSERADVRAAVVQGSETAGSADIASELEAVEGVAVETMSPEELEAQLPACDAVVVVDAPPVSDGLATFERIRESGELLPVVLVGVDTGPERVETALTGGVTEYVHWDDDAEALAARLRAHVRNPYLDGTVQATRREAVLSSFAHDAKNPLNVVSGRMELLEVDATHADAIVRSLNRVESLIAELRTVGSFAGPLPETEPIELDDTAQQVWAGLSTTTATLTVETERPIEANRDYLAVILVHLFENAIQHGGDGVSVVVGGTDGGFYVADDGPGISEDVLKNVFDQGYGTARDGEGYGLFVADRVAGAHGWTVTAGASDEGGARFDVQQR